MGRGDSRDLLCVGGADHICIASESIRVDKAVTVVGLPLYREKRILLFCMKFSTLFSVAIPRYLFSSAYYSYCFTPILDPFAPFLLTCLI